MTLGQKLKKTRLARGLTQAQLAGDCVTRNMLSQIENDLAKPSMRTLNHLAGELGVSLGWLLEDSELDPVQTLSRARELYRAGSFAACAELLEEQPLSGQEPLLLRALCGGRLAGQALENEDFSRAEELAVQALALSESCLYPLPALEVRAQSVLLRCAMARGGDADAAAQRLQSRYLELQTGVCLHLLLARYHLEREHIQAAEREIWSIAELPEVNRAEYLILRGRVANKKEQYENAALYFGQAEELEPLPKLLRRELYAGLELCHKEQEQYKQAYAYAQKLRELD